MTTSRKMFAAVALAAVALFGTVGIAVAGPNRVHDGGNDGGHSNSDVDQHGLGDDNKCNFKYNRDGTRSKKFDGGNKDCPTQFPVENPPNPGVSGGQGSNPGGLPTGIPGVPSLP